MAKGKKRSLGDAVQISATIVLIIFGIYYVNRFLGGILNAFGIWPRQPQGLAGILFSPLLHYSDAHLTTNMVSLFLLLVVLFLNREYRPDLAFLSIWILSGLGTWIIGRSGTPGHPMVHIGASGVIYGLVTYLIAAAWWLRSWSSFLWSIAILFLYGGIFYGALPQRGFISWEGHLAGAIAGVLVAWRQHK
ncbi:MAG TPA: rhomboid family intramembrane serine protease [Verrucomicrobiae bacterium]